MRKFETNSGFGYHQIGEVGSLCEGPSSCSECECSDDGGDDAAYDD